MLAVKLTGKIKFMIQFKNDYSTSIFGIEIDPPTHVSNTLCGKGYGYG